MANTNYPQITISDYFDHSTQGYSTITVTFTGNTNTIYYGYRNETTGVWTQDNNTMVTKNGTFSIVCTIGHTYTVSTSHGSGFDWDDSSIYYNARKGQGTSNRLRFVATTSALAPVGGGGTDTTKYTVTVIHSIEGNTQSGSDSPEFYSGNYFYARNYNRQNDYGAELKEIYDYTNGYEEYLSSSPQSFSFSVTQNRTLLFKYWIYPRVSYKWALSSKQLTISVKDRVTVDRVWVYLVPEDGSAAGEWRSIGPNDTATTYTNLKPGKRYKIRTGRYENDWTSQNYKDHEGVPDRKESDSFVSGTIKLTGYKYTLYVTYETNGGNGYFQDETYEQEGDPTISFNLPSKEPTLTGKIFDGWKESFSPWNIYQSASVYEYTFSATTADQKAYLTFTAQWVDELSSVKVTYYWGKNYKAEKDLEVKPGETITSTYEGIAYTGEKHGAWGELQEMVPSSLIVSAEKANNISLYYGFKWYNQKEPNTNFSDNFKAQEWRYLIDFVNSFTFANLSKAGVESGKDFTAEMYNDMMTALGRTEQVEPGDKVTHTIINNIATYANDALKRSI